MQLTIGSLHGREVVNIQTNERGLHGFLKYSGDMFAFGYLVAFSSYEPFDVAEFVHDLETV